MACTLTFLHGPHVGLRPWCSSCYPRKAGDRDAVSRRDRVPGGVFSRLVGGLRERFELTKYVSAGTSMRPASNLGGSPHPLSPTFAASPPAPRGESRSRSCGSSIACRSTAPSCACAAALDIAALCVSKAVEFERLAVGAGIATGSVIHGMIGSLQRAASP